MKKFICKNCGGGIMKLKKIPEEKWNMDHIIKPLNHLIEVHNKRHKKKKRS